MYYLVTQSFGRESEYRRSAFAILSFFAHIPSAQHRCRVLLFTDQPEWFSFCLSGLDVKYFLLTPEKIRNMRGQIDFLHRMKIALIEEAFDYVDGPLFYIDSDTFFTGDPSSCLEGVSDAICYMHKPEYPFRENVEDRTPTYQAFYCLTRTRDFALSSGDRLSVTEHDFSWNAGGMLFAPSHRRLIPDVYCLTDQFYPATHSHASEQYSFSLVLQRNLEIRSCEHILYHYWYRIKKQITDQYLGKKMTVSWLRMPLTEKLDTVRSSIPFLQRKFRNHYWMIRDHAIQAFNEDLFVRAYAWTFVCLFKFGTGYRQFWKDVLYHTKRSLRTSHEPRRN